MSWVVLDFETRSFCDLKKAGAWRYAEDITTEILCLSWCKGDGPISTWFPGEPCPPDLEAAIEDEECFFIAHNADFEKSHWRKIMVAVFGWKDIPNRRWHDTAAKAAMLVLPPALEKVGKCLNLTHEKDMEGNRLTLSLSRPHRKTGMLPELTPEIKARVGTYCEGDVAEQRDLHRRIGWLPEGERRVWLLDQEINERGLGLDLPLIRAMQTIVDKASVPLEKEFQRLTGFGLNQRDKVMGWMMDRGVLMPNMQKETLAAVLGETEDGEEVDDDARLHIPLPDDVRRALHIRQLIGSASVKKLAAMEACIGSDGRAHGLLKYHRAGPGRWAGALLQPQNFPRGTIHAHDMDALVDCLMHADPDLVEIIYGPAVETIVSSLRHTIIAKKGHALLAGDFAGIEARVVLALAGQHDKCALLASGADVYIDMACSIFGLENMSPEAPGYKEWVKEFKAAHLEERQTGKNTILGCGFGMGAPKFHGKYCPAQPLDFAQDAIDTYRQDWAPLVPELWRGLERAACKTVWERKPHEAYGVLFALEDMWLTARLPSGRKLWYFDPRPVRRAMPWDPDDIRPSWTYRAYKTGRMMTIDAYGGLITENVVQGLARDLLVHAMFKARKEALPIVLTVHDELVCEPEIARADEKMLGQIMKDIPDWARQIKVPVDVECWAGERYRK